MPMYVSKNQFWNNTEECSGKFTKCGVKLRNELLFLYLNWYDYQLALNLVVSLVNGLALGNLSMFSHHNRNRSGPSKLCLSFRFPHQNPVCRSHLLLRATCAAQIILLDLKNTDH